MVRLEIAAIYAGLNILLLLALSVRVMLMRRAKRVTLGDGGDPELRRAMRAHGNAAEYIPAGLVGITLAALLDPAAPAWLLHAGGGALTLGRAIHAVGLSLGDFNAGRAIGMTLTWAAFLVLGVGLIWAGLAQQL